MAAKDLSKFLGKVRNRIYRVGVELEGGWRDLPEGTNLTRDGSIMIPSTSGVKVGELPSDPMEVIKIKTWMKKYYPQITDKSCGMHVHMSFKSSWHYAQLMSREYQDTIVAYLTEWAKDNRLPANHPIWNRLAGRNEYCKLDYYADVQVLQSRKNFDHNMPGSRYTAINYCFGLHETVECRILPMMENYELGVSAVMRVIDITNAYLVLVAKKEGKSSLEVIQDGPDVAVEADVVSL